jgi:hypothetical protein
MALEQAPGARRVRRFAGDDELGVARPGHFDDGADDGAVAGRTGIAIVTGEEMLEELVDFLVFFAGELDIFVKGEIAGAAGVGGGMEGGDRFELEPDENLADTVVWHGRQNSTTTVRGRNGTLVLRGGHRSLRSYLGNDESDKEFSSGR